jgi:hypothetical protein
MKTTAIAAILFALSLGAAAPAVSKPPSQCDDAIDDYNRSVGDLSSYLSRYSSCVQNSQGYDDCSTEFRRVRNTQSDFEAAVSNFQSECD